MLGTLDITVIIAYFAIVFIVAGITTFRERKLSGGTPEGYFLGGRNIGWFVVGASLFASNIGSEHLVGLSGSGAAGDFPAAQFEILAAFILMILGWVFVPFYLKSGVFTMPEFLERRYNRAARNYLSIISIVAYVLTKISVTIAAGGIVFTTIGVPFWTGALIIVVATGIYTIFGGLRAVVYTDMIQMFVLIAGALAVSLFGLSALGGWGEMTRIVEPEFLSLWRDMSDADFPWTGIIFGAPILGVWYWCTDQFIVQRVLSARNVEQARKGTIFGAFLKLTPLFLFVLPGVIAYALMQKGALSFDKPDEALPMMITNLMPAGLKGLVIAGLLAALMSSLSSVFNSCSTLFTFDIYQRLFPETAPRRLVLVGQIATGILVLLGLAWIPMMDLLESGLFKYLQSVQAYISPPIAAVFLFGIFYRRINSKGAMAALITGGVLGLLRLTLEVNKASLTGFWETIATINFLHFAILLFSICCLVMVVVSLMTRAPEPEKLKDITYQRGNFKFTPSIRTDLALSVLLVVLVGVVWVAFS